ncbi:MAG: FAD:protein FMN transferase [Phycisphaerae bacterium]|nr:FAD:protein FMN transferase [Phycisphaerae bacterium]
MIEPGSETSVHCYQHEAMACTFGLGLVVDDERFARQVARAAFDELDRLEQLLSRFIPHSDIARINGLAPGQSVRVEPDTVECLRLAAQLQADTGGAFDIAFRSRRETPSDATAETVPPLVFDPTNHSVGVQMAGVVLDLGGLGKGYALDRIADLLREWGIFTALVHSGESTVSALGRPAEGAGWRVGLRNPEQHSETLDTLELSDYALSGSGQLLHGDHIIDPRGERPAAATAAAWALAPTAVVADALSTAFMVMSVQEVEQYCGRQADVSAILRTETHRGRELVYFGRKM